MPLAKITHEEDFIWGVWKIEESEADLFALLDYPPVSEELSKILHPHKRREFLSSRLMVRTLCDNLVLDFYGIGKNENFKPHLHQFEGHLSISHCQHYAVAAIHLSKSIGIDIEDCRRDFSKVVRKLLYEGENEIIANVPHGLCKIWCIKEAIYKADGNGGITFGQDIRISQDLQIGYIVTPERQKTYLMHYDFIDNHYIAIAIS